MSGLDGDVVTSLDERPVLAFTFQIDLRLDYRSASLFRVIFNLDRLFGLPVNDDVVIALCDESPLLPFPRTGNALDDLLAFFDRQIQLTSDALDIVVLAFFRVGSENAT